MSKDAKSEENIHGDDEKATLEPIQENDGKDDQKEEEEDNERTQIIEDEEFEFEILRVKDRFKSISEPCGYRDFMINVLCVHKKDKNIKGIICEVQLHHLLFYSAKKTSHKMYKKTRLFQKEDGNEAYEYAKKYVRPVIGRFKTYPIDDEEENELNKKSNVLNAIQSNIERVANQYCKEFVIPKLNHIINT